MKQPGRSQSTGSASRIALVAAAVVACQGSSVGVQSVASGVANPIANLHAFARLYGAVRWFHPSDAAALIDWDRFAVEGVRAVLGVRDVQELRTTLTELIAPIGPTVRFAAAGESFPIEPDAHLPDSTELEVVAWEHLGYGDSAVTSAYVSKRRHRVRTAPVAGYPFGALWQEVDASPYRGSRIRLRGKICTSSNGRGHLWLRVERGKSTAFLDNMYDRPVANRSWESVEIVGTVDRDATRVVLGTLTSGNGAAWFDDIELAVQAADGSWLPVEVKDPGFELSDPLANWHAGLARPGAVSLDGWKVARDGDRRASGSASLRVEAATREITDELFADAPKPLESVDIELGSGLRARVPIALYSREGRTIGDDPEAARASQAGAPQSSPSGFDVATGVADVIVAWNVLQHFWPYWDTVSVDWVTELDVALRDALDDRTLDDHVLTLQRLSAAAPDGHGRVGCPGRSHRANPPFTVEVVEDQLVVTTTADPALRRGDVITRVDGRPSAAQMKEDEALISGSPQWRRVRATTQFGAGPRGSTVKLRIRRGGVESEVAVVRNDMAVDEFSRPAIQQYDDGVYYIDLSRATLAEIDAVMERVAAAPGVVFDVRFTPNGNQRVLSHLLTTPDNWKTWLAIPHVIRPDHTTASITDWTLSGWELSVHQPHITGRVAFLIGPRTASYAESVMGLVEHYHLGEIVGSATAGANGNIAQIAEPTGCYSTFTGLRVTKADGARFHLIGVLPTIPASRTLAGVAAGRDEILERALMYVRGAPNVH